MAGFRRRVLLVGAAATLVAPVSAKEVIKEVSRLRPGEFVWHPERAPEGPVTVIVSIPEQRVHVYRNGIRIAASTCSTGKAGHETPTGVFLVLEKDADHHSSTYDDASMPFMNRLTWDGIALHAGNLPGYPASHGCVRLPIAFARKLFTVTGLGTPVIIAGGPADPSEIIHPGMVLTGYAGFVASGAETAGKRPGRKREHSAPVVSVLASSADKKILLLENGEVTAEGALKISGFGKLGSHVFVLKSVEDQGRHMEWVGIDHGAEKHEDGAKVLTRLNADKVFSARLHADLHEGAMFVVTDLPMHPNSRTGKDFVIMS
ncbi:MAG: L,D-transpeptidase [Rhizobium sp.]|nr:L,D-transpeptidase [Rhizobium sp.]